MYPRLMECLHVGGGVGECFIRVLHHEIVFMFKLCRALEMVRVALDGTRPLGVQPCA